MISFFCFLILFLFFGSLFYHIDQPLSRSREIVIFKTARFQTAGLDRCRRFSHLREVPHDMADAVGFQEIDPDIGFLEVVRIVARRCRYPILGNKDRQTLVYRILGDISRFLFVGGGIEVQRIQQIRIIQRIIGGYIHREDQSGVPTTITESGSLFRMIGMMTSAYSLICCHSTLFGSLQIS